MDQQEENSGSESGFVPDAYNRPAAQAAAGTISPLLRRWRLPAVVTTMAMAAAFCLYDGSAAHASHTVSAASPVAAAHTKTSLVGGHFEDAATNSNGGIRGSFSMYDGEGGGVQFWFNPTTGDMTVAVGAGMGAGVTGTLGTYEAGQAPAPGTYLNSTVTFAAGTVGSANMTGNYSFDTGKFTGSVSITVDGRTVTLNSDGTTNFNASVTIVPGAPGFSGSVSLQGVFDFNWNDVVDYIYNALQEAIQSFFSLISSGPSTSNEVVDDPADEDGGSVSATTDSSTGDDGDDSSGDDSGDGGGGGGGGGGGCAVTMTELPDRANTTTTSGSKSLNPAEDEDDAPVDVC
ncbi:MAG TPA: hypothetical protein VL551_18060 [Actinospica sp.]|jgi:hypothetical protein|nr:hypothetical protein [Actinospica sp.]